MFSLTRAILGLEPDAPNRTLYVDPQLPSWLPDVTLTDLRLGDQVFDVHFRRADDDTVVEVRRGNVNAVQRRPKGRLLSP
jgi:hypothetical protein